MSASPTTLRPAPARLGRDFRAQLASTGVANLGDGLLATLAPLVALGLTSSPALISLLSAATWLPWLVLGIAAGAIIDRVDRRRAQIWALGARATLLAAGSGLALVGRLSLAALVVIVLLYGATEVFADLGATAIIPDLVPSDLLPKANGRVLAVQQLANSFLGAPLAGALIVVGGAAGFGASAGLAALAALVLAVGLRGDFSPRSRAAASTPRRQALAEIREGLGYLWRHPVLRPLVLNSSLMNLANTGYFAVFVVWVVGPSSHFRLTETQYPFLLVGFAVGAIAGSVIVQPLAQRFGEIPTMMASLAANTLLLLGPLVLTSGWALGALLAAIGALNTIGNVIGQSLRQRIVPRELLGRVGGSSRTLAYGLMPIGALLGGQVAEHWGLPVTFVSAVAVCVVSLIIVAVKVTPGVVARYETRPEPAERLAADQRK